jgi:uncharacterized repeat protein (TIGR01451 family)
MKKIIYLAMVLVLALSLLAVPAFADAEDNSNGLTVNLNVTADKTTAQPGDTVTYTFAVSNATGLAGVSFSLDLPDGLKYVSNAVQCTDKLPLSELTDYVENGATAYKFDGTMAKLVGVTDSSFTLFTLTCQVAEDAKPGSYGLTLTGVSIYDGDEKDFTVNLSAASLKVACANHVTETKNAVAATCKEAGYTGDKVCTVCGTTVETGKTIEKTAHSYTSEVTTEATCKEAGVKTFTCSVCGDTYTETIEKIAHTPEVVDAKDATCYEEGYTGDTVCSVCGEELEKGEAIEKIAHTKADGDEGTITTLATAKESGVKTFVCAVDECGQEFTESYEAAWHKEQYEEIPASVLEKAGVADVEGLKELMKPSDTSYTNIQVFEVVLKVDRGDGKGEVEATADDFPLTITLDYPETIATAGNYNKYVYTVTHLKDDGTVETLACEKTADGLKVTVNSLSPIAISWKDAPVTNSGNGSSVKGSNVPNTGDNSAIVLWTVMLGVCAMGAVTVVASKKKTSK